MMKKYKKTFEEPKLNVIRFEAVDVIATSGENYVYEPVNNKTAPDFDIPLE